ncbi:TetR/AcrR family transcriptional regulator [Rhodococcus sp. X156]|uniref:TetR/AcrR family transcriptional regulator n=1 Tax=Rhodococcus sp. X156 TaxID=2499145 RepID=UPI001F49D45E|nr:TetR/AcrR family transcriptional regulator [Rhodococcus sp. X156]
MSRTFLTRERVMAAAAELVDRDGVDALNLTRLAATLSVRQSALYNHVSGVSDVLRGLSLHARSILAADLRNAAVGLARDDAVRALAEAWRRFVQEHPGLYAATDRYPTAPDAELSAAAGEVVTAISQVLAGYGLDAVDSEQAGWSLRSALHGFCVLEATEGSPAATDLDLVYQRLVAMLCAGISRMASVD